MNPDFVTHVVPAAKPITMSTNAGSKRLTVEGTVPGARIWDCVLR